MNYDNSPLAEGWHRIKIKNLMDSKGKTEKIQKNDEIEIKKLVYLTDRNQLIIFPINHFSTNIEIDLPNEILYYPCT